MLLQFPSLIPSLLIIGALFCVCLIAYLRGFFGALFKDLSRPVKRVRHKALRALAAILAFCVAVPLLVIILTILYAAAVAGAVCLLAVLAWCVIVGRQFTWMKKARARWRRKEQFQPGGIVVPGNDQLISMHIFSNDGGQTFYRRLANGEMKLFKSNPDVDLPYSWHFKPPARTSEYESSGNPQNQSDDAGQ